jgi:hypothetical protein
VRDLALNHGTLAIPGTAFCPTTAGCAGRIDEAAAATLAGRLTSATR